jgi:hypothetical protein
MRADTWTFRQQGRIGVEDFCLAISGDRPHGREHDAENA